MKREGKERERKGEVEERDGRETAASADKNKERVKRREEERRWRNKVRFLGLMIISQVKSTPSFFTV